MEQILDLIDIPEITADEEDPEEQGPFSDVMYEIIDEVSLGLCFDVHRACKFGIFFLDEMDSESQKQFEIVDREGLDIFGQAPLKKQLECTCPNCDRTLAASRFAPHLEKCMGMGRNSSRIASRRIANNSGKKESDNESAGEEDDEAEWGKAKRLKRDRYNNSPRRGKFRLRGDLSLHAASTTNSNMDNYENLTMDEKRMYLTQSCGVISEHTKKMCTRSQRCPMHTDEQRRTVRLYLLGNRNNMCLDDEIQVDIEEDADACLRDSLQWEHISNASPTDSTSTTSSIPVSRKRRSKSRKKGRSTPVNISDT